jgi:hypothetical protein
MATNPHVNLTGVPIEDLTSAQQSMIFHLLFGAFPVPQDEMAARKALDRQFPKGSTYDRRIIATLYADARPTFERDAPQPARESVMARPALTTREETGLQRRYPSTPRAPG